MISRDLIKRFWNLEGLKPVSYGPDVYYILDDDERDLHVFVDPGKHMEISIGPELVFDIDRYSLTVVSNTFTADVFFIIEDTYRYLYAFTHSRPPFYVIKDPRVKKVVSYFYKKLRGYLGCDPAKNPCSYNIDYTAFARLGYSREDLYKLYELLRYGQLYLRLLLPRLELRWIDGLGLYIQEGKYKWILTPLEPDEALEKVLSREGFAFLDHSVHVF